MGSFNGCNSMSYLHFAGQGPANGQPVIRPARPSYAAETGYGVHQGGAFSSSTPYHPSAQFEAPFDHRRAMVRPHPQFLQHSPGLMAGTGQNCPNHLDPTHCMSMANGFSVGRRASNGYCQLTASTNATAHDQYSQPLAPLDASQLWESENRRQRNLRVMTTASIATAWHHQPCSPVISPAMHKIVLQPPAARKIIRTISTSCPMVKPPQPSDGASPTFADEFAAQAMRKHQLNSFGNHVPCSYGLGWSSSIDSTMTPPSVGTVDSDSGSLVRGRTSTPVQRIKHSVKSHGIADRCGSASTAMSLPQQTKKQANNSPQMKQTAVKLLVRILQWKLHALCLTPIFFKLKHWKWLSSGTRHDAPGRDRSLAARATSSVVTTDKGNRGMSSSFGNPTRVRSSMSSVSVVSLGNAGLPPKPRTRCVPRPVCRSDSSMNVTIKNCRSQITNSKSEPAESPRSHRAFVRWTDEHVFILELWDTSKQEYFGEIVTRAPPSTGVHLLDVNITLPVPTEPERSRMVGSVSSSTSSPVTGRGVLQLTCQLLRHAVAELHVNLLVKTLEAESLRIRSGTICCQIYLSNACTAVSRYCSDMPVTLSNGRVVSREPAKIAARLDS
eukprot:GHVQ01005191.1.p1 GENE.GHVQ01005191.1~~GHVQ01005191.1.p1  ORF type:complete len:612 (+),score=49.06 GHVQ01005191.1:110-1945(+)